MKKYLVVVETYPSSKLKRLGRAEKRKTLIDYYNDKIDQILNFIKSKRPDVEVDNVNRDTVFNTLFIESNSKDLEKLLEKAPGVKQVAENEEISIDLL